MSDNSDNSEFSQKPTPSWVFSELSDNSDFGAELAQPNFSELSENSELRENSEL